MTFAHVRRFPYERLTAYLELLAARETSIRWDRLRGHPRIEQPNRIRMLQVADVVAGCLFAALRRDEFGDHEPAYLVQLAPRFWRGPTGKLSTYGLHFIGTPTCECPSRFPWWPLIEA